MRCSEACLCRGPGGVQEAGPRAAPQQGRTGRGRSSTNRAGSAQPSIVEGYPGGAREVVPGGASGAERSNGGAGFGKPFLEGLRVLCWGIEKLGTLSERRFLEGLPVLSEPGAEASRGSACVQCRRQGLKGLHK